MLRPWEESKGNLAADPRRRRAILERKRPRVRGKGVQKARADGGIQETATPTAILNLHVWRERVKGSRAVT